MKVELNIDQYMEMLKAFTEYSACKAECYRLQEENRQLKQTIYDKNANGCSRGETMPKHRGTGSDFSLN